MTASARGSTSSRIHGSVMFTDTTTLAPRNRPDAHISRNRPMPVSVVSVYASPLIA